MMIYQWIHEIFTTFFIDISTIPADYQPLLYLIEFWALLIFFKWCLYPFVWLFNALTQLGKGFFDNSEQWRKGWQRKQKRSLRKFQSLDDD